MRLLTWALLAAAAWGGVHWWQQRAADGPAAVPSPNGFIAVAMPGGVGRDEVLVLAPPDCPSRQAQRADTLVTQLQQAGIPVRRGSGFSFQVSDPTPGEIAAMQRTAEVVRRGAPAVFVNGMGMSDPALAQVVAELRRTGG